MPGETIEEIQRQRGEDADLDGADRYVDLEICTSEVQLQLVAIQSGGRVAPATVCLPGPVQVVG